LAPREPWQKEGEALRHEEARLGIEVKVRRFPAREGQREVSTEEFLFPLFEYHLDESDPDIVVLRRQDDAFVAAFSARGVKRESIVDAARKDYCKLVQVHMARQLLRKGEEHRSA
jgi:hypothetical protein